MKHSEAVTKAFVIGDKRADYSIIQGGMGVGVSLSNLAGAVAAAGGVGIISTAQIGFDEPGFEKDTFNCNIAAIKKHILKAKEIAAEGEHKGLVGVNVMTALKHYREHVRAAVQAGADVVICGAGLPLDLPELVEGSDTKIAPIVSGMRACRIILKQWENKYNRTADFVVFEGPAAGGHLGFHLDELEKYGYNTGVPSHEPDSGTDLPSPASAADTIKNTEHNRQLLDDEIKKVIEVIKEYEAKFNKHIPLIAAGGIFTREDIEHAISLGAQGVQVASRFVATQECDASDEYKQAYIKAEEKDVCIIKSPVGMPGRALNNTFAKKCATERIPVKSCYQCLSKCNPAQVPYCITKALIAAVRGDTENGLVFCGANVGKINKIQSVSEVMEELLFG